MTTIAHKRVSINKVRARGPIIDHGPAKDSIVSIRNMWSYGATAVESSNHEYYRHVEF